MSADRYYFLKEHHICVKCGQRDAFRNKTMCPECLEKEQKKGRKRYAENREQILQRKKKRNKALYARKKAEGLCVKCGQKKATKGVYCLECYVKERKREIEKTEKRKRENGGYIREIWKEKGLCAQCGEPTLPGKRLCQKHYEIAVKNAENARKYSKRWQQDNQLLFMKKRKSPHSVAPLKGTMYVNNHSLP